MSMGVVAHTGANLYHQHHHHHPHHSLVQEGAAAAARASSSVSLGQNARSRSPTPSLYASDMWTGRHTIDPTQTAPNTVLHRTHSPALQTHSTAPVTAHPSQPRRSTAALRTPTPHPQTPQQHAPSALLLGAVRRTHSPATLPPPYTGGGGVRQQGLLGGAVFAGAGGGGGGGGGFSRRSYPAAAPAATLCAQQRQQLVQLQQQIRAAQEHTQLQQQQHQQQQRTARSMSPPTARARSRSGGNTVDLTALLGGSTSVQGGAPPNVSLGGAFPPQRKRVSFSGEKDVCYFEA